MHATRSVLNAITLPPLQHFLYLGFILKRRRQDFKVQQKILSFLSSFLQTMPSCSISHTHKSSSFLLGLAFPVAFLPPYSSTISAYPAGREADRPALLPNDGHAPPSRPFTRYYLGRMTMLPLPSLASVNTAYTTIGQRLSRDNSRYFVASCGPA